MKCTQSLVVVFGIVLSVVALSAASAQRPMVAYCQFEGMRGTSTDAGLEDWTNVVDFRLETVPASSEGGRVITSSGIALVITKRVDENTGRLADGCSRRRTLGQAQLVLAFLSRGAIQGPYTRCNIRDAALSRHVVRFDAQLGTVVEDVHLTVGRVSWEYSTGMPPSLGTSASTAVPRSVPKPAKRLP